LEVLHRLVDAGNTVVVIEHNLDVIKTTDHVVDLGPEGGPDGGHIIATGTPEQVARTPGSFTGVYLKKLLAAPRSQRAPQSAPPARSKPTAQKSATKRSTGEPPPSKIQAAKPR